MKYKEYTYTLSTGEVFNSIKEVADHLEVGKMTVRALLRKGIIKQEEINNTDSYENKESTRLTIKRFGEV